MTPVWLDWVVGISAAIGAVGALLRWVIRPILRTAVTMESATPVLAQIARDFQSNGGSTLKKELVAINDRLTSIEAKLKP